MGIVTEKFDFVVVYFVVHLIGAAGREYLTSNGVGRTYSDFSAHRRALWEPKAIVIPEKSAENSDKNPILCTK